MSLSFRCLCGSIMRECNAPVSRSVPGLVSRSFSFCATDSCGSFQWLKDESSVNNDITQQSRPDQSIRTRTSISTGRRTFATKVPAVPGEGEKDVVDLVSTTPSHASKRSRCEESKDTLSSSVRVLRESTEPSLSSAIIEEDPSRKRTRSGFAYEADPSLAMLRKTLFVFTDGSCPKNSNVHGSGNRLNPAGWSFVAVRPAHEMLESLCRRNLRVETRSESDLGLFVAQFLCDAASGEEVSRSFGPVFLPTQRPDSDGILSHRNLWLGAGVGSNNTGELSALLEAMLYLLHHCPLLRTTRDASQPPPPTTISSLLQQKKQKRLTANLPEERRPSSPPNTDRVDRVVLCYDSTYAAKSISGEFNGSKNRELIMLGRSLLAKLRARADVQLVHVKAHNKHAWNELSDALALRGAGGELLRCHRFRSESDADQSPSSMVKIVVGDQTISLLPDCR